MLHKFIVLSTQPHTQCLSSAPIYLYYYGGQETFAKVLLLLSYPGFYYKSFIFAHKGFKQTLIGHDIRNCFSGAFFNLCWA